MPDPGHSVSDFVAGVNELVDTAKIAANIEFTPTAGLGSSNVQAAIEEVDAKTGGGGGGLSEAQVRTRAFLRC